MHSPMHSTQLLPVESCMSTEPCKFQTRMSHPCIIVAEFWPWGVAATLRTLENGLPVTPTTFGGDAHWQEARRHRPLWCTSYGDSTSPHHRVMSTTTCLRSPSRARLTGGPSCGHRGACGHICHRGVAGVHRDGLPGDFRVTVPAAGISLQRSLDAGDFIAGKSR